MSSGADGQVSLGPRFVPIRPHTVGRVPHGASVPTSVKNYLTADLRDTARIAQNYLVIYGYDSEAHALIDFKKILDETKYSGILIKRYEPHHMAYYHYLQRRPWWREYRKGVLRAFLAVDKNMSYTWGNRAPLPATHDDVIARMAGRISTHIMRNPTRTTHTIHFNAVSGMAYQPGEKIGIHADTEPCHVDAKHPFIASLSFGRSAEFSNKRVSQWSKIILESGDLLLSYGDWLHTARVENMSEAHRRFRNPPMEDPAYANGRLNFTFRLFKSPDAPGEKFQSWNEITRSTKHTLTAEPRVRSWNEITRSTKATITAERRVRGRNEITRSTKATITAERRVEMCNNSISVTSAAADKPAPARKRARTPTGKCPLVPVNTGAGADKKAKRVQPQPHKRPRLNL